MYPKYFVRKYRIQSRCSFWRKAPNVKLNPAERFHSCLSSDSDHSLCIENELETIKTTLDKVVKRDDIENIVPNIMGKLVINLKKEIKQEIMAEVGKGTTKMRNERANWRTRIRQCKFVRKKRWATHWAQELERGYHRNRK